MIFLASLSPKENAKRSVRVGDVAHQEEVCLIGKVGRGFRHLKPAPS